VTTPEPTLSIHSAESPAIAAHLGAEIAARFGPRDETSLSILARTADGTLVGGLNGVVHWRWLYIRHLWVAEAERGGGIGRRLLATAEGEARRRSCMGMYVDTFDRGAARFYECAGFSRSGEITDLPPGARRIYLSRHLP
jgi:GNAT superfamily N-acetyltransferase